MAGLFGWLCRTFPAAVAKIVYGAFVGKLLTQLSIDMETLKRALALLGTRLVSPDVEPVYDSPLDEQLTEGLFEIVGPTLEQLNIPLGPGDVGPVLTALSSLLDTLHPSTESLL